jgi:Leucine-rich repeat (LRR) protein
VNTAEEYPAGEAGRRINEAARNQAGVLDLSHLGLSTVPDTIGQLTSLTSLYLGLNRLTTVPDAIGRLTSLTELDLSGNQLTAVPDTIGQLTNLTTLNIEGNPHLPSPPPEVTAQGAQAVLAFLRAHAS